MSDSELDDYEKFIKQIENAVDEIIKDLKRNGAATPTTKLSSASTV
jgi:hypothetical protein